LKCINFAPTALRVIYVNYNSVVPRISRDNPMPLEDYLKIGDICSQLKISKVTLWNWRHDPSFPKPIKIGITVLWKKSDIEAYLESKKVNASEPKTEKNETANE
jgi:predicted DNA-binding transcriptional regulator AlpA